MAALFNRVTVWVSNQVLTAAALNGEFNNILNNAQLSSWVGFSGTVAQMQQTTSPGGVGTESLAASGSDEIQRLRFMFAYVLGTAQWYDQTGRNLGAGKLAVQTADIAAGAVTQVTRAALGQAISGSSGPAFSTSSTTAVTVAPPNLTATISIASPGLVTISDSQSGFTLSNGDPVSFTTTGALPTGLTAGTTYYVLNISRGTSTTFNLATTSGGLAINTSGSQSGVQTLVYSGLSLSLTTTGRPVSIHTVDDSTCAFGRIGYSGFIMGGLFNTNQFCAMYLAIYRNSTLIYLTQVNATSIPAVQLPTGATSGTQYYISNTNTSPTTTPVKWTSANAEAVVVFPPSALSHIDVPAAGTYTYTAKVYIPSGNSAAGVVSMRLLAFEN